MPESDATPNEQQTPPTEEAWRDKILGDAMGYTKGLVTVLDSLNEGFRRRGQELEELRHRLIILQNERRTTQEWRGGLEAQVGALTAERDKLRSALEERDREFEQLRQELSKSQAALEARTREIQEFRTAGRDSTRQAEELREIVRDMERERLRAREAAAQAQQEQAALRDRLARTERLLETARRDLTDSQNEIALRGQGESADRKSLQLTVEERDREIDKLRQELSQGQTALEGRTREIEELQAAVTGATRREEELHERIRELERGRESDTLQHTACLAEVEGGLQQAREAAAQAQQEQAALRDSLGRTERLLETARRDLTGSQEQIAILRGSLEREQARAEYLQDQLRSQWQDFPGLNTTVQTARGFLRDIAVIVGGPPELVGGGETDQEEIQWAELVQRVRGQIETAAQTQEELAALRRVAESVQRVDAERQQHPPATDRPALMAKAAAEPQGEGALSTAAADTKRIPSTPTSPKGSKHRNPLAGMRVECMLEGSGGETTRILRGEISRLNAMGLMGVFDARLPEGRRVVVRLTRGDEVFSCVGRVLRVRPSGRIPGGSAVFDHLIRFDSPMPGLPD